MKSKTLLEVVEEAAANQPIRVATSGQGCEAVESELNLLTICAMEQLRISY